MDYDFTTLLLLSLYGFSFVYPGSACLASASVDTLDNQGGDPSCLFLPGTGGPGDAIVRKDEAYSLRDTPPTHQSVASLLDRKTLGLLERGVV